jgi:hypothetical protein
LSCVCVGTATRLSRGGVEVVLCTSGCARATRLPRPTDRDSLGAPVAMNRITLIHWNADEARKLAMRLRSGSHTVTVFPGRAGSSSPLPIRKLKERLPDVFVIDLTRIPSQGRAVGVWLRQQKATRTVPIVFVGGESAKVADVRRELPDATFTDWQRIRGAIRRAIRHAAVAPIVPGTMDRYKGRSLATRLGIKPSMSVAILGAPANFPEQLGPLPAGVRVRTDARVVAELILLFVRSHAALVKRLETAKRALAEGGSIWVVWPKQTSGVKTDLTQRVVRSIGLDRGLVDYKICAVDDTWSGLRFARRTRRSS